MKSQLIIVLTTVPTKTVAARLAKLVLKEKIVACAQISGPIISHYLWEGKLRRSREWVLTLKTLSTCYALLEKCLTKHHPYDVPEIVAAPASHAFPPYAGWVKGSVRTI